MPDPGCVFGMIARQHEGAEVDLRIVSRRPEILASSALRAPVTPRAGWYAQSSAAPHAGRNRQRDG
jgi:hypothetical protein